MTPNAQSKPVDFSEPTLPFQFFHPSNQSLLEAYYQNRLSYLSGHNDMIDLTRKEIQRLRKKRRVLRREDAACRGVLSTFRQLPAEILSEIFRHYVQDDESDWEDCLRLCWVCRHWRHVALSTPTLWTSPFLSYPLKQPSVPSEMIQFWISTSCKQPLEIDTTWPLVPQSIDGTAWDIIMPELGRIEWLRISDGLYRPKPTDPPIRFNLSPPCPAPLLKTLKICFSYDREPGEEHEQAVSWAVSLIRACSVLQDLSWRQADVSRLTGLADFLQNLTVLNMERYNGSCELYDFMLILCSTPLLESCEVSFEDHGEESTRPVDFSVVLEHLTSFNISGLEPLAAMFENLTTPKLQELYVSCQTEWPQNSFMGFLRRSSCHLTIFSPDMTSISETDVIEWLKSEQLDPSLVELGLLCSRPVWICRDSVIEYLLVNPSANHIPLPNLESLALTVEIPNQFIPLITLLSTRTKLNLCAPINQEPCPVLNVPGVKRLKDINIRMLIPDFPHTDSRLLNDVIRTVETRIKRNTEANVFFHRDTYRCPLPRAFASHFIVESMNGNGQSYIERQLVGM